MPASQTAQPLPMYTIPLTSQTQSQTPAESDVDLQRVHEIIHKHDKLSKGQAKSSFLRSVTWDHVGFPPSPDANSYSQQAVFCWACGHACSAETRTPLWLRQHWAAVRACGEKLEPERSRPMVSQPGRMLWSSPNSSRRRRPCSPGRSPLRETGDLAGTR